MPPRYHYILQGHPGPSRALRGVASLLTLERAVPHSTHLGVFPHLHLKEKIDLLRNYRRTSDLVQHEELQRRPLTSIHLQKTKVV